MYGTYNLEEIRDIINQATQQEMYITREDEGKCRALLDMKTRLYDLFGIEEE